MPKIINAYAPDDTVTSSLKALADSFFGGDQLKNELYRQKAKGLIRENENLPLTANALARGDAPAAIRFGVLSGLKGDDVANYGLYGTSNRVTDIEDPALSRAVVGAGKSAASSPWGVRQAENNRLAIENERTRRMAETERFKVNNTPQTVVGPDNQPMIARQSDAFGMRPVLPKAQEEGNVLRQDLPSYTPEQRAAVTGVTPKNPATVWVYRNPDGSTGSTADGKTDLQTGRPIPPGPLMKLEGANTEGLSGNNTVDRQVAESRIFARNATGLIDGLITEMQKPDAAQSLGYLGTGARWFNDLRAQAEAVAHFATGISSDKEIAVPDVQNTAATVAMSLFERPQFNARMQHLGVNAAILKSRIVDLAYTMAKAQDPGGRISKDDILRSGEVIGTIIMDPVAGAAVLSDLKRRILTGQEIREQEYRRLYPKLTPPGPLPESGASQTGGAPAAAPTGNPVYDINGNPVR